MKYLLSLVMVLLLTSSVSAGYVWSPHDQAYLYVPDAAVTYYSGPTVTYYSTAPVVQYRYSAPVRSYRYVPRYGIFGLRGGYWTSW